MQHSSIKFDCSSSSLKVFLSDFLTYKVITNEQISQKLFPQTLSAPVKKNLKSICKMRNSNIVVHYAIQITSLRIDIKSEYLFFLQDLKKVENIHYDIWINETKIADPSLTFLNPKVFNFTQATLICLWFEKALMKILHFFLFWGKNLKS